jgi:hypothetical protein
MFSVEFAKLFIYRYYRASFKDVQLGGGRETYFAGRPGEVTVGKSVSLQHQHIYA